MAGIPGLVPQCDPGELSVHPALVITLSDLQTPKPRAPLDYLPYPLLSLLWDHWVEAGSKPGCLPPPGPAAPTAKH